MEDSIMKFKYWKDPQKQWRWHLVAANGEIIAFGESYKNKKDCLKVINLIKNSANAEVHLEVKN